MCRSFSVKLVSSRSSCVAFLSHVFRSGILNLPSTSGPRHLNPSVPEVMSTYQASACIQSVIKHPDHPSHSSLHSGQAAFAQTICQASKKRSTIATASHRVYKHQKSSSQARFLLMAGLLLSGVSGEFT